MLRSLMRSPVPDTWILQKEKAITPPEVSILLPVHGEAPYLGETLRSVLSQTFENWELLILLDRASRPTEELCRLTAESDNRIKIHKSKQSGLVAALSMGVEESSANLIARIDADDLMDPKRLEKQVREMAIKPNLVCLGSQIHFVNLSGKLLGRSNFPTNSKQVRLVLPATNCIAHPSVMLRKCAVQNVGGYLENLDGVEDYHLWLKLLQVGDVENHPERLTFYRIHPNQMSRRNQLINRHLESLARIDVFSVKKPLGTGPWADQLTSMTSSERDTTLSELEKSLPVKTKKFLRASRNLSSFLQSTSLLRIKPLASALIGTPARTISVLAVLFNLYRLVPLRRHLFGSNEEETT